MLDCFCKVPAQILQKVKSTKKSIFALKKFIDKLAQASINYRLQVCALSIFGTFVFVGIYEQTFVWLYERYVATESYYSHGFLIPFITGFLIYRRRALLSSIPVSCCHWGLGLLTLSLLLHFLSVLVHVYFLSGFSILLFIIGVSFFLFGAQRTKIIIAPLLYLIFMFPLPLLLIQKISLPLKEFVTYFSVGFTNFLGIQAVKTGFVVNLSDGALVIGAPCSGLRSIFSFLALGAVFLMVDDRLPMLTKTTFLLICIPIALFSNMMRVVFLITTGTLIGTRNVLEGSFYHDFSGYAVFVIGLMMMSLNWKAFKWTI